MSPCSKCEEQNKHSTWGRNLALAHGMWEREAPPGISMHDNPVWIGGSEGDRVPIQMLHWMCIENGVAASGDRELLRERVVIAGAGGAAPEEPMEWEQPPADRPTEDATPEQRRCAVMCIGQEGSGHAEMRPALGAVVRLGANEMKALGGFDTWAEVTCVRRSMVQQDWRVLSGDRREVKGVGVGTQKTGELVEMPVRVRYGSQQIMVPARVMEDATMPEKSHVLFGTADQWEMGMVYDCVNERAELRHMGVAIDLELVDLLRERMENERGIRVLELCSGVSGSRGIVEDLGFDVERWDTVEKDSLRAGVGEHSHSKMRRVAADANSFRATEAYDMVLAGPTCQPWSRANDGARGFQDVRSAPFRVSV